MTVKITITDDENGSKAAIIAAFVADALAGVGFTEVSNATEIDGNAAKIVDMAYAGETRVEVYGTKDEVDAERFRHPPQTDVTMDGLSTTLAIDERDVQLLRANNALLVRARLAGRLAKEARGTLRIVEAAFRAERERCRGPIFIHRKTKHSYALLGLARITPEAVKMVQAIDYDPDERKPPPIACYGALRGGIFLRPWKGEGGFTEKVLLEGDTEPMPRFVQVPKQD